MLPHAHTKINFKSFALIHQHFVLNNLKVKVKLKLSLCLTKHYAMKMYGGADVQIHAFLMLAPVRGKWQA
jgi:hypothetical protein